MIPGCSNGETHTFQPGYEWRPWLCGVCGSTSDDSIHDHDDPYGTGEPAVLRR